MKKFLFIATLILALGACKKDNPTQLTPMAEVTIEFKLYSGTTPVEMRSDFALRDQRIINVLDLKFYVSNLSFISQSQTAVSVEPVVHLIRMQESNHTSMKLTVEPGLYSGLQFNPGLDSAHNASNPVDFPREHPLSAFFNMHWNWNLQYRFVLMELRAMDYTPPIPCSYHPGTNPLLRQSQIAFDKSYSFEAGKKYTIEVWIDASTIFDGPSGFINFQTENQAHAEPGDFDLTKKFMENFAAAFKFSALKND